MVAMMVVRMDSGRVAPMDFVMVAVMCWEHWK